MRRSMRAVATALTTAVAIALAGCSVSLDEAPGGGGDSGGTTSEGAEATGSSVAEDANTAAWREAITAQATQTQRCNDDTLEIDGAGVVVAVTGTCERLIVSGTTAVVVAEQVGTLEVSGTGAVVVVASVDAVTVSGTSALVYWGEGTPTVTDSAVGASYGNPPAFTQGDLP